MPLLEAAATAGAGVLGGVLDFFSAKDTNETNKELARENREWNSAEAQKNRNFQEQMSSSAHRRSIADLKAAGINPILAVGSGGASSPSGSTASASSPTMVAPQIGKAIQSGLSGAVDVARLSKDNELADSALVLQKAQTMSELEKAKQINATTADIMKGTVKKEAEIGATTAQKAKTELEAREIRQRNEAFTAEQNVRKEKAQAEAGLQKYDSYIKRVGDTIGVVTNALEAANPFSRIKDMMGKSIPKDVVKDKDGDLINKKTGEIIYEGQKTRAKTRKKR